MKIEVEIVSKQLIKPSSPSPDHLRHYNLSFIDQIQVPFFNYSVQFYPKRSNINTSKTCNLLKRSLSQVLTIFYPLAGRIRNNSYVDCNDEGFLFVEANANCQLSVVLRDRNPSNSNKFIPIKPEDADDLAACFQITFFSCGGIVISFGMSHKLGDGLSLLMFLNCWATIARGNTNINISYIGPTLFPPHNMLGFESPTTFNPKEKAITKVFVFDASTIEALKAKYTINGERPSRVEALSAFIWSRFMATTQAKEAKSRVYKVIHGVNLRSRMELTQQKPSFGNLIWFATAEADMAAKDDDSYGIVKRMKDSIGNINADAVKKLQNSDEQSKILEKFVENYDKEVVSFTFSGLCGLPTYESDFGWGKPLWVGIPPHLGKNLVFLADTKEGRGIEAWISLTEEDMSKFEIDNLLLAHVSLTSDEKPLPAPSRL